MFQDGPCGHDRPAKAGSRDAVPRTPANAGHPEGTRARTLFLPTISSTFHSLSKVLFIFPSRYLFAIGLLAVFSLGWSLPPALGLDSQTTRLLENASWSDAGGPYGAVTLSGKPPFQGISEPPRRRERFARLQFRGKPRIFKLGSSRFARRYSENPGWFLFLRLVICLNSAGNLVRLEANEKGGVLWQSVARRATAAAGLPRRQAAEAARRSGAGSSHFTRRRGSPGGDPPTGTSLPRAAKPRGGGACGCGARAGMPSAEASGAMCVQGLDDSRSSAIRITYRISLRSSSIQEPRYPSSGVVQRQPW